MRFLAIFLIITDIGTIIGPQQFFPRNAYISLFTIRYEFTPLDMMTVLTHRTLLVTTNSASFRETLIEYSLVYPVYLFVVYLTKLPKFQKNVYEALYPLILFL